MFLNLPPPSLFCRLGEVSDLFLTIFVNAEESRLQSLSSLVLSKIFLDGGIDAAGNEMLNTVNRTFLNCLTVSDFLSLCVCVCVSVRCSWLLVLPVEIVQIFGDVFVST